MKKTYTSIILVALFADALFLGCKTTNSIAALPKSAGKDPFAQKVFASDTEVLQFEHDGTSIVYALDVENGGLSKEIRLAYSYNTKDKTFSTKTIAIYTPDGETLTSKAELVAAELPARLASADQLFSQIGTPVDQHSQEWYKGLLKDSLERSAEHFFSSVLTSAYTIQKDGDGTETLILTDIPAVDFGSENINFGFDTAGSYNVAINDYVLVLADLNASTDTQDVAYVGIPQFDQKKQEITAHLYAQTVTYTDDLGISSLVLRDVGDVRILYDITLGNIVQKDDNPMGFDYYAATYTLSFVSVPAELSKLTEVRYEQNRHLFEVAFTQGILADFSQ